MIQITVDGKPIQTFLVPIATVENISILQQPFPIPVPKEALLQIASWVYDLTQKATGHIIYNNIIMTKAQVKNPIDIMEQRHASS